MTTTTKPQPPEGELFTAGEAGAAGPGTALAMPSRAELDAIIGAKAIAYPAWIKALADLEQFEEENTEEAHLGILKAILTAATSEQALAVTDMLTADDLVGEKPGGRSNVLEFHRATPLASTFDQGPSAFAVIAARDLAEERDITFSCGARAVQAVLIKHQLEGWMPFRARLVRRLKPTRAGFYPLNLEAGI